jgi:Taurine catabolism dioxygenase TauD, TfdA family
MYHRVYIPSAQRYADAPRLTSLQTEALDMFDELANSPEMSFSMRLAPGDMQFVYNHSLLHDRTAYEDDSAAKRHLMRVWVALPDDRPLPGSYATRYGSVEIGNRGGVWVKTIGARNLDPSALKDRIAESLGVWQLD